MRPLWGLLALTACAACGEDFVVVTPSGAGGATAQGSASSASSAAGTGGAASTVSSVTSAAATTGSGGMGGDAPCVIALEDDFESETLDAAWSFWGGTAALDGGELRIAWTGDAYGGIRTQGVHQLEDCSVFLEVSTPPTTGQAQAFFYAGPSNDDRVGFYVADEQLRLAQRLGGSNDNLTIPFDKGLHRWWRLRESGGQMHWDTSPDGETWTEQRVEPTPAIGVDAIAFNMGAGPFSMVAGAGEAAFDNVNVVP